MTTKQFNTFMDYMIEHKIKGVMCKKSAEYARGDDKLYNFKRAGQMANKSSIECLRGMKLKHDVSIDDMLNDINSGKDFEQEKWQEKLSDDINYLFLLWAILFEQNEWELK
jgi:hypothetical protein